MLVTAREVDVLRLVATGKFQLAVDDFNAALNVDAKNGDAWAQRGAALERLGNAKEAGESYQKALIVDPNNRSVREFLQSIRQ